MLKSQTSARKVHNVLRCKAKALLEFTAVDEIKRKSERGREREHGKRRERGKERARETDRQAQPETDRDR